MQKSKNTISKRVLCWILTLAMVLVFMPFSTFAAEKDAEVDAQHTQNSLYLQMLLCKDKTSKDASKTIPAAFWQSWSTWGQYFAGSASKALTSWKGVDVSKWSGTLEKPITNIPVSQFGSYGSAALKALSEMIAFNVGVADKHIVKLNDLVVNNWEDLQKGIEALQLQNFDAPKVTVADLQKIMSYYPNVDWEKIISSLKVNLSDYGFDKDGQLKEIPFNVLKLIFAEAAKLGTDVDLSKFIGVWSWMGSLKDIDWATLAASIEDWDDILNLDFMSYLKNLKWPVDSLDFSYLCPVMGRSIDSITIEPVKANSNVFHNGLLTNIAGYTLADDNGFVTFDKDGNAKVLYKVVVHGTPGATFTLDNGNASLVSSTLTVHGTLTVAQAHGKICGFIPWSHAITGDAVFFVSKTYTKEDIQKAGGNFKYDYLPLSFDVSSKIASIADAAKKPVGAAFILGDNSLLVYEVNGGIPAYQNEVYKEGEEVLIDKYPFKAGFTFTGWYLDSECKDLIDDNLVKVNGITTIYAGWKETPVPEWLDPKSASYIIGYEDFTFRPAKNITRAEAATIIYRLLKSDVKKQYETAENTFVDVNSGDWFNKAVSTLANMGLIQGKSKTVFAPDDEITRGEFAALIARLYPETKGASNLTDISGSWAKDYINKIYTLGLVAGYTDNTFNPIKSITRAEAVAIINRVLHNIVTDANKDAVAKVVTFKDVYATDWYRDEVALSMMTDNIGVPTETAF